MKKIIFAGILTVMGFALHAQKAQFGLKGGVNFSTLEYETHEENEMKSGFHVGGLVHIHVSRNFAVQPELVFSSQGSEFNDDEGNQTHVSLSYINVPVMLQYMTGGGFRIQTGPQVGFLLGAEAEVGDVQLEVDDAYKSTDFSWAFGAGYQFPGGFGIDARYNLGLSNINDATSVEVKNRVFQVGVFYQFNK